MKSRFSEDEKIRIRGHLMVVIIGILLYAWLANFKAVNGWIAKIISPIVPVLCGLVIAYFLNPILVFIEKLLKKTKLKSKSIRPLAVVITYVIALALIVSLVLIVAPQVVISTTNMATQIKSYVETAETWSNNLVDKIPSDFLTEETSESIRGLVGNTVKKVLSSITSYIPAIFNYAMSIGSGLISIVAAIAVSVYALASKETFIAHFKKINYAFLPRETAENIFEVVSTADKMFGSFLTGKLLDSLIVGVICYIGLLIMRMPYAILLAFIVGVTNIIPYFGPLVGEVCVFLILAFISPLKALITLIFVLVLQQLDGNVIGPKILGKTTGLSGFWVIFSILFFGGLFGVVGMFIGVPLFGVIYWWIRLDLYKRLKNKGLPEDTDSYK